MAIASLTYNHYSKDITIQYGTLNNPYIYKHLFLVTSKKSKKKIKQESIIHFTQMET
jgi:hypothetical protein